MDDIDRALIQRLQEDTGRPYAAPAASVGLSAGATHERVHKLRERGVIRRTTVEVDPAAVGSRTQATVVLETFFERPLPL